MQFRLLGEYVDEIICLKMRGVYAKNKSQADLGYPMTMRDELVRVFNAVRVSPPTTRNARNNCSAYYETALGYYKTVKLVLQLLQSLKPSDELKRFLSSIFTQDAHFAVRLVFGDGATFHLSGKLNRHKVLT